MVVLGALNESSRDDESARLGGRLSELTERRGIVERWENSTRHLQLRSVELELQFSADIDERHQSVEEIASLYSSFAYEIYGGLCETPFIY